MRILLVSLFVYPFLGFAQLLPVAPSYIQTYHVQTKPVPTAVPFLLITPDARAAGLGDAGLGLSPDANSIHWNSATLAFSEQRTETSVSYSPWLHNLLSGVHHFYTASYIRLGKRHAIGHSFRYFHFGNQQFLPVPSNYRPEELEFQLSYSLRISKRAALGINGKLIRTDMLREDISTAFTVLEPQVVGAADLSFRYQGVKRQLASAKGSLSWGITVSNLGGKIAYANPSPNIPSGRSFLPSNLRLGAAYQLDINENHRLNLVVNGNKLMVPTHPIRDETGTIISGMNPEMSSFIGLFQSFVDAPGEMVTSPSGSTSFTGKGRQELREWTFGGGIEYNFLKSISLRSGYRYQHPDYGIHHFMTFGMGVEWKFLKIDASYLTGFVRTNPLNNTVRFSLTAQLPGNKDAKIANWTPPEFD